MQDIDVGSKDPKTRGRKGAGRRIRAAHTFASAVTSGGMYSKLKILDAETGKTASSGSTNRREKSEGCRPRQHNIVAYKESGTRSKTIAETRAVEARVWKVSPHT